MRDVIAVVALTDWVACKKTEIKGKPVWSLRTASMSYTQKAYVMSIIKPVVPFKMRVQSMLRGNTREASLISSANARESANLSWLFQWCNRR